MMMMMTMMMMMMMTMMTVMHDNVNATASVAVTPSTVNNKSQCQDSREVCGHNNNNKDI